MDDATFDRLARTLSGSAPRRRLLGGALGAVVAALASVGAAPAKPKRQARQNDDRRERGKASGADGQKNRGGNADDDRETSDGPADAAKARCVTLGKSCKKKKKGKAPKCCADLTCSKPTFTCGCPAGQKPCGATCIAQAECCPSSENCATCKDCAGCCVGTNCEPGTSNDFCGAGGVTCVECPGNKPHCSGGTCVECTEGSHCQNGQACVSGECRCTGESCSGCCDGKTCVTATSAEFCGTAGEACTACGFGQACEAGTCACTEASCGDGNLCCDDICKQGADCCATSDCSGGFVCSENACTCPNNRVECAGPICCERDYVCHATSGECCLPEANPCGARECGTVESCGREVPCGPNGGGCAPKTCKVVARCTQDGVCQYDDAANRTPCDAGSICCGGSCVSGVCCADADCGDANQVCTGNRCVCAPNRRECLSTCCGAGEVCTGGAGACCKPTTEICGANQCGWVDDGCGNQVECSFLCNDTQECIANVCRCTPAKCKSGCCAGDTCESGTTAEACGADGAACTPCGGDTPYCKKGGCVECRNTGDCTGDNDGLVCSPQGACVPCTSDPIDDCDGERFCQRGLCVVPPVRQVRILPAGSAVEFRPAGLAYDPDGNLYVSDKDGDRVIAFDPDGRLLPGWTAAGGGQGAFNGPDDIAIGPDGTVFVSDEFNSRIQMLNPDGTLAGTLSGSGVNTFDNPEGIAIDADGNVFVVDSGFAGQGDWVEVYDSSGMQVARWGGDGVFAGARGVAIGQDGAVYVADGNMEDGTSRIQVFERLGDTARKTGQYPAEGESINPLGTPYAVAIDPDGFVYLTDDFDGTRRLVRFHPNAPGVLRVWNVTDLESKGIAVNREGRIALPIYTDFQDGDEIDYRDGIAFCTPESSEPVEVWLSILLENGDLVDATGVAVDDQDNAYAVDTGSGRIFVFDPRGILIHIWDTAGQAVGAMSRPMGNTWSGNDLYVTDTGNDRVLVFDDQGNARDFGATGLDGPKGIAVANGHVYVVDAGNGKVRKFGDNGQQTTEWDGSSGHEAFVDPVGIATDASGNVYVVDSATGFVQKFDGDGNYLDHWGGKGTASGEFDKPNWIAVGADGKVFVAEHGDDPKVARVNVFDGVGTFLGEWGSYGKGSLRFQQPRGIAVGADGTVWVVDIDRVKVFAPRAVN